MLKLQVIHYKGAVPPRPIVAQFGAEGGTIGRANTNTLVLPDTERYISRTHAKIEFQDDHYVIEDHGSSTPVMVNGLALGRGGKIGLAHGDELTIGEYQLRTIVQLVVTPAGSSGGVNAGAAGVQDHMTMFGNGSGTDPFADLIARSTPPAPLLEPAPPASAHDPIAVPDQRAQGAIPADFDPFGNLGSPPAPPAQASPVSGMSGPGFGTSAQNQNLDALFGLNSAPASDPFGGTGPLSAPPVPGPTKGAPTLDPLEAFQGKPAPSSAQVQHNDVPELFGAYVPPKAIPVPDMVKPAEPESRGTAARDVLSGVDKAVAPARFEAAPAAVSIVQLESESASPDVRDTMASTQRVAMVRPGGDALTQAFLEGAGIAQFKLPSGLTPHTMNMLGQVLRNTIQAMLDSLLARAMLKREMREDVTMIVAQENNPLKFSPNVEAALMHLLMPKRRYMQPLEAVEDACNDLHANQFAFMAGMRAALASTLQRFDPDQLEQRLKHKTMLDSLLPAIRKAKMWDLFSDLYGDISKEAEDNFHEMFRREFVRAYEEQAAKHKSHGSGQL